MPSRDCIRCGKCCDGDRNGWVLFTQADLERLAGHLGKSEPEMLRVYGIKPVVQRGLRAYHKQIPCPWFDQTERSCAVHEVKPTYCRLWPFGVDRGVVEARQRGCAMVANG